MSTQKERPMTRYVVMLLASNDIAAWWGQAAHIFGWILLQGYVVFPSTFIAYNLAGLQPPPDGTGLWIKFKRELYFLISHIPLFAIAWGAVIIGGLGMFGCLLRWRRNYVWGLNQVITPGFYAASTGLVSTAANIWGVQHGNLSAASKLTLFVTGGATGLFAILWIIYSPILLRRARREHINNAGYHGLGQYGEGRLQARETVVGTGERAGSSVANLLSGSYVNA